MANPSSQAPESGAQAPISDAELSRIKRALANGPAIKLTDQQLRFYVEILAKMPTFAEYSKGYDFINGPTKRGDPMTHQEYLDLVTPKELHSSGGITAPEMLQFAVTNWLGKTLIQKALDDVSHAKDEHEIQQIRERINRELEALKPPPSK